MKSRKARYKEYVDEVFSKPDLFFRKGKVKGHWVIPEINLTALAYHLGIGVGTAYIVKFGIWERLKKNAKQKVEILLKKGEGEGEVIIHLQQGELWSEHGPFKVKEISGADPTPLLLQAARAGLVIPLSLTKEIRDKIRLWIEKGKSKG